MQPASAPCRLVRAFVVAAVCVGSTLSAHVLAGGMVVPGCSLLLVYGAVGAVTYTLSGRRWTFGRLLVALGAAQVVLHPAFDLLAGGAAMGRMDTRMLVAHGVAAVGLAAVMARGDTVLWRTAQVVSALLRPLVALLHILVPVRTDAVVPACPAPVPDLRIPAGLVVAPGTERAPPWRRLSLS